MPVLIENFTEMALQYMEMGFSVIPVGQDKKPLVKWEEYQQRKPTEEEIRAWATSFDNPNIGVVTGAISGVVVVDIEAGGSLDNLPETVMSKTGGGGHHCFYKHPGFPVKNAVRIREKTDVRGDGGYIVAPSSLHQSGNRYEWINPPDKYQLAELPTWVLSVEETNGRTRIDWGKFVTQENQPGTRNMTASQLAGKLLYELPPDLWEIGWLGFCEWNAERNNPPLGENELRDVWQSIQNRERPKRKPTTPNSPRKPIGFATLEETLDKWLLMKDRGVIRIITATVIANRMTADPVWLFIVAPPGATKTELIRGLAKIKGIYPLSDLTPQTFLSGEKGNKSASLLTRIQPGTIFTYKDFTTVLTMHRDKQQAIISQLREIFDGSYRKEFGTGESKEWEGKVGFIAGVTPVFDRHHEIYAVLGERFVQYRPVQPDYIAVAKKAIANSGGEDQMREEIQNAFADFVEGIEATIGQVSLPDWLIDRVANLASFVTRGRSGVIRDGYSTREIEQIPDPELPTRLAKQLITLSRALALIRGGRFTEEDYELIYKIGLYCLPQKRRLAIEVLLKNTDYVTTVEVAEKISYPTNTTRRVLEDIHGLKLASRESQGKGHADKWKVNEDTRRLLEFAAPAPDPADEDIIDKAKEIFGVAESPAQQDLRL